MSKVFQVFGLGFVCGFAFLYFPWVTIAVVVAALLYFHGSRVMLFGARTVVPASKALIAAVGITIMTHLILTLVFGASAGSVIGAGGITALLKDPGLITAAVGKELIVLVICGCVLYLWYTQPGPQRWLFKLAAVTCVFALTYSAYSAWAPVPARYRVDLQQQAILLNSAITRWSGSKSQQTAKTFDNWSLRNRLDSGLPELVTFHDETNLFGKESKLDKDGRAIPDKFQAKKSGVIPEGSAWRVHLDDQFYDDSGRLDYVLLMSDKEPDLKGYAPYYLVKAAQEAAEAKEPVKVLPPVAVSPAPTPAEPKAAVVPEPPKVSDQAALKRSTVMEDVLTINAQEWTDSEVVPYTGDTIVIGPYAKAEDVARILCRIGGAGVLELKPVEQWDGKFVGRIVPGKGANTLNAPLRFKLKAGDPLSVSVRKSNPY